MSETINFTRLTTSDKLSDRFLTCQYYQPVDLEQRDLGVIFSQIEILTPWFPTSQIGQTVINTLIREYYRGSDTSVLVNFENAIKAVNKVLAQIAQNGETDWIGKFSGCLVLINGKEMHIAQTGRCHAYLYRDSKINHITEGLEPDDTPHPLKTFSNLTSGTLQTNDKVIIGNASFFDILKPSELKVLAYNFRPAIIAFEAAKILKSHNSRNANAVIIELTSKEALANVPPEQKVEVIYLDQSSVNLSIAARNFTSTQLVPAAKVFGSFVRSGFSKIGKFLAPRLKKSLEKAKETSVDAARFAKETAAKSKAAVSQSKISSSAQEQSDEAGDKDTGLVQRKTILKFKNKTRRFLIGLGIYSRDKSKMVLILLAVIILILAGSLGYSYFKRASSKTSKNDEAKFSQLTSLETDATVALTRGDEVAAFQKYNEIMQITAGLASSKEYGAKIIPYVERADAKIKSITKIKDLGPSSTYTLNSEADAVATDGENIFAIYANGGVKVKRPTEPVFGNLISGDLSASKIVSVSEPNEKGGFALTQENKKLSVFDPQIKTVSVQDIELDSVEKIGTFGSNFYLLSPLQNQIIKLGEQDGQYKDASNYIKDQNVNVSDAVDLAIDGSIFVLNSSGHITKFSRGNESGEFQIKLPAEEKLTNFRRIITSSEYSNIVALADDQSSLRVIIISKTGKFLSQYKLQDADLKAANSWSFDLINNKVILLSAKKVLVYQL